MSFQGKEFTAEMKEFVILLKKHFDTERKKAKFVLTKNATLRVAKALGIGEATVKRIMAERKKPKESLESKKKGKPPYKVSSHLEPIIRDFIRQKNLKGQKVSTEELRKYLSLSDQTEIPSTTLLRTLKRLGFVFGIGERRNALKEQEYVINARRNYLRQKIANRGTNGITKRPEVYLDETYVNKNHSRKFTWYLEENGPYVNKPSGKGPRLIIRVQLLKTVGSKELNWYLPPQKEPEIITGK